MPNKDGIYLVKKKNINSNITLPRK